MYTDSVAKKDYLEANWHEVRDNVKFTSVIEPEDMKAMETLRWL